MSARRWGRNQETPGEDPYLTGEYAMQWIRGMQFGIPGSPSYDPATLKVAATAKHFSNYGIENYGNFVSATADPVNGLPHSTPLYPPVAQGWKPTDDQAAYCTDSSVFHIFPAPAHAVRALVGRGNM